MLAIWLCAPIEQARFTFRIRIQRCPVTRSIIVLLSFGWNGILHFHVTDEPMARQYGAKSTDGDGTKRWIISSFHCATHTFDFIIIIKYGSLSFRCKQLINFTTSQITYFSLDCRSFRLLLETAFAIVFDAWIALIPMCANVRVGECGVWVCAVPS